MTQVLARKVLISKLNAGFPSARNQISDKKMRPSCISPISNSLINFLFRPGSSGYTFKEGTWINFLKDLATREFNAFLWISLITITALLLRKLVMIFVLWTKANRIPGPPCPTFRGHCKLISSENITDVLWDSHEKYGPVVKLWLGPTRLLVSIKDPKLIREMLFKAEDKLPLTGKAFHLAFGRPSLFAASFDKVQERRETLVTELNEILMMEANAIPISVVDCIMERIQTIMKNGSIDCKLASQHIAFTFLGATLFGDAFIAWSKATIYEELFMMIAKDAGFWASYNVIPLWKRRFWKYRYLCTKLKCLTQDIVQLCRENYTLFCNKDHGHSKRETNAGKADMMANKFFFQELRCHLNGTEEEPCSNIMGLMLHGCITTAALINNTLLRLATHPEIQDKIYSEITTTQRISTKQTNQNVDKMLLLMATVYESARLLPAGPLLQRCSLSHDFNLESGVTIPAGAVLVVPVQLVQMDGCNWGSDACDFNPYRFLSKAVKRSDYQNTSFSGANKELGVPGEDSFLLNDPNGNAAFLPFGSGTRACVGQKFVMQGVATLFASLLQHYEIKIKTEIQNKKKPMINGRFHHLLPNTEIVFLRRNA